MPARYDTIIVVRKRNAKGEVVEYHTVGRKGPSIWRTGEPNPPGTPGYQAAYDEATGVQAVLAMPADRAWLAHGRRPARRLRALPRVPRPRSAHPDRLPEAGWSTCGPEYGSAPLGIVNSVALKGNVLDWVEVQWAGKGADRRLDPFKFALSWATGRHPERVPVNYLHGIPRFYEGADRAEIIWEDAEVDLFCQQAPEAHADAVRLARETGLRIGDLVELERSEIKKAPDGSRVIILRPNKRRRRIVNMPLTAAAEAIIDKAPLSRRLILKPKRADAWDPARLSREVREYATEFGIRPELRFNDLRGTKVTEMVWSGISVPDLAIRIGWKIETAAKMLGVIRGAKPRPHDRREQVPKNKRIGWMNGRRRSWRKCVVEAVPDIRTLAVPTVTVRSVRWRR